MTLKKPFRPGTSWSRKSSRVWRRVSPNNALPLKADSIRRTGHPLKICGWPCDAIDPFSSGFSPFDTGGSRAVPPRCCDSIRSKPRIRSGRPVALALAAMSVCLLAACVSPKYQRADKNAVPVPLNVKFPASALGASLYTEISDGAPGSWKREAFWDEYVVTLHNRGDQSLKVTSMTLTDYKGAPVPAGSDPWALEKESKSLERRYRDAGVAFARMAAPRVVATTAEPGIVASAGIGSAGAATAATATAVAIPVYGLTVFGINMHNKKAIKKEFDRRRLPLPMTLGPGETRTGSIFFPMIPNPQALTLRWTDTVGDGETVLDLHFLEGLHVASAASDR